MILYFLKKHFNDREELVTPMEPLILETSDGGTENVVLQGYL